MKYTPEGHKPHSQPTREHQKGQGEETVVEGCGKLDFGEYELELWDRRYNSLLQPKNQIMQERRAGDGESNKGERGRGNGQGGSNLTIVNLLRPSCLPLSIVVALSLLIVLMALLDGTLVKKSETERYGDCDSCRFQLVESIPENLTYTPGSVHYPSIYDGWVSLIERAESSIDIVAFYWTLLNNDVSKKHIPSSWQGEDILNRLNHTGLGGKVKIRIAQNSPSYVSPQTDSALLAAAGAAQVRSLDFKRLIGNGVLHTKLWVVDQRHLYVGSANMDWRSLTQVKEVGVVISNCSCLVNDINKIFEVYWRLGEKDAVVPPSWPQELQTDFNAMHQMTIPLSGSIVNTYLSSSPPSFCPKGRSNDIDAILDIINKAKKFIYVAVMDYFPRMLYTKHKKFWPMIDDGLRRAAWERGVHVRVLGSHWSHTRPDMPAFLKSLQDLSGNHTGMNVHTKLFVVPSFTKEQKQIPFGRVNHNKYMVTDNTAYIGTSNWSGDYFVNTGGVGLIVNETTTTERQMDPNNNNNGQDNAKSDQTDFDSGNESLRAQLQALFERDWDSEYARPVDEFIS